MRFTLLVGFLVGCGASSHVVEIRSVESKPTTAVARPTRHPHVRFEGNESVGREALADVVEEDDAERDASRILGLYYDLGYVLATIADPVVAGGVTTYRIHEGERFRLRKIEAHDLDADGATVATPDGLPTRAHLHARSGEWFSRRVWVDDMNALRALYHDVGYPCVEISPTTHVDLEHRVVDLIIEKINLGPRVTIDRVDVIAPSTDVAARARQSLGITRGDLYDATKLEDARKRLLASGAWSVDLSYQIDGAALSLKNATTTIRVELTPRVD